MDTVLLQKKASIMEWIGINGPEKLTDYQSLLEHLPPVVKDAGAAIMDVYCGDVSAEEKPDGSPVTLADQRAEAILLKGLQRIVPDIPIVSEENAESHLITPPERYFLVDPLDGTREFLKADGKGSFTVNIGLIENGVPTFGIIYAPCSDRMFCGVHNPQSGARMATENGKPIAVRSVPGTGPVALGSLSHEVVETKLWLEENGISQIKPSGSSLKFCLLACGEADVYPRFSPTMEWDTAAGHAILLAAGGRMELPDGGKFEYGKEGYRNGAFIARAGF